MSFDRQFRFISYLAVFCGFFALWVSGTFGVFGTSLFVAAALTAWKIEGSRWQISERVGTTLVVLALPFYYFLWRFRFFDFSSPEAMLPGILARLILTLTAIKLLQKKSDRDWMFLFLMAFFEVLLAAGLSISIAYLVAFVVFVFVMAGAIILFQIRKTDRATENGLAVRQMQQRDDPNAEIPVRRVFALSAGLLLAIAVAAVPLFFLLPRVSGAGIGGGAERVSAISGFSDSVRLGGIGRIQQNDAIVMRVRIENEVPDDIHWRGVALDTFDGQYWTRSRTAMREPKTKNDRDLIQVDNVRSQEGLTLQTVYLEPLDTPVIFGLYRMVGIQGNFPILYRDAAGAITFQRTAGGERISYKVLSDTVKPSDERLRSDRSPNTTDVSNYLQLPNELDPRIAESAENVTANTSNRYDAARAVERYLQTQFGYTLEPKATGDDPLADFLFNVREGHCEYFATAMAIMLRTKGIATRVVNGFQRGEYNDTADVYVIRQRNAHSWVEVYFPETESWITFDPTPPAGQNFESSFAGITDHVRKYMEALETFWIQYFVAFDNQEQRSLFVSVRRGFGDYQNGISSAWAEFQGSILEWWKRVRGDEGIETSLSSLGVGAFILAAVITLIVLFVWLYRKVVELKVWSLLWNRIFARRTASVVEFYERMERIMADKGVVRAPHLTPLEFANAIGAPEALDLTRRYQSVRFGNQRLSLEELTQIEDWLEDLEDRRFQQIAVESL